MDSSLRLLYEKAGLQEREQNVAVEDEMNTASEAELLGKVEAEPQSLEAEPEWREADPRGALEAGPRVAQEAESESLGVQLCGAVEAEALDYLPHYDLVDIVRIWHHLDPLPFL